MTFRKFLYKIGASLVDPDEPTPLEKEIDLMQKGHRLEVRMLIVLLAYLWKRVDRDKVDSRTARAVQRWLDKHPDIRDGAA